MKPDRYYTSVVAFVVAGTLALCGASAFAQTQAQKDTDDEPVNQKELEQKACGPKDAKSSARTDKKNHPTPEVPPDMALIYVVRPTMVGNKMQTKLAANGEWLGVNRGNTYFYVTLPPGEHYLCSQAENKSVMTLAVEAGQTYYLQQKIRMGFMKARNQLVVLDESEGRKHVAKAHLSVSEEKR